jgi:outer membrane protein
MRRPLRSAAVAAAAMLTAGGCAHFAPRRAVSSETAPSAGTAWVPTRRAGEIAAPEKQTPPEVPESWKKAGTLLSLGQLVDIALRNNPATRTAWFQARSAAAEVGIKRAAWFPTVNVTASLTRTKQAAVGGQFVYLQTTYGPAVSLNYLLFDFGGRAADVDEARAALFAANWAQNAAIDDVILKVEATFYQYQTARALRDADRATLDESQTNLDAAQARHRAGVATIADVLQAKTAVSQARLALQQVEGQIETIRGALATALGLPASYASLPIDVEPLPAEVNAAAVEESVDSAIEQAEKLRPDLAQARSIVAKQQAHVRSLRSEGLPTLSASGTGNRTYYYNRPGASFSTNYSGTIELSFPLFEGMQNRYEVLQAQEDARVARAQLESLDQQAMLQVWTSYSNLKTAVQQLATARDLLDSATQSEQVAAGRYREGVGSILDLLTAQSALADARAKDVDARSQWFVALAQLAHDTGRIAPPAPGAVTPANAPEKDHTP